MFELGSRNSARQTFPLVVTDNLCLTFHRQIQLLRAFLFEMFKLLFNVDKPNRITETILLIIQNKSEEAITMNK